MRICFNSFLFFLRLLLIRLYFKTFQISSHNRRYGQIRGELCDRISISVTSVAGDEQSNWILLNEYQMREVRMFNYYNIIIIFIAIDSIRCDRFSFFFALLRGFKKMPIKIKKQQTGWNSEEDILLKPCKRRAKFNIISSVFFMLSFQTGIDNVNKFHYFEECQGNAGADTINRIARKNEEEKTIVDVPQLQMQKSRILNCRNFSNDFFSYFVWLLQGYFSPLNGNVIIFTQRFKQHIHVQNKEKKEKEMVNIPL